MSKNEDFSDEFIKALFNPNSTDSEVEELVDKMLQAEMEANLPPIEQRAKTEAEVCALLARQAAVTSVHELEYYLTIYYNSLEVASLVARHPSIEPYWLAQFLYFLPEDAKANPKYEQCLKDAKWEGLVRDAKPYRAEPYSGGEAQVKGGHVNHKTPWRFKVNYWLAHGTGADKRYVLSLKNLDESVLEENLSAKSSPLRKAIASRETLSVALAIKLCSDKARTVRLALAENFNCPQEAIVELTNDGDEVVRNAALSNPNCPEDSKLAAKLIESNKLVKKPKSIDELSENELIELLGEPSTSSEKLTQLVSLASPYVRAGVALHSRTSVEDLRRLASDPEFMVRESVAFNPRTPTDILQTFLDSSVGDYYRALASNPSLTEQQQLQLVRVSDDRCRLILADTTELHTVWCALRDSEPSENSRGDDWRNTLKILLEPSPKGMHLIQRGAKTRQLFVSKIIARHPKCSPKLKSIYAYYLFDSLAQNPSVALKILENPNSVKAEQYADWKLDQWLTEGCAPGHVSNFYLQSEDIKRRRRAVDNWTACLRYIQPQVFYDDLLMKKRLAAREGNTRFMFEVLARDKKSIVREMSAQNAECPPEVLAHLSMDKTAAVKVAAKQNKNFSQVRKLVPQVKVEASIEEYRNKGPKRDRIRMAQNSKSTTILRDLAQDKMKDVRIAVASNGKTDLAALTMLAKDEEYYIRRAVIDHNKASDELIASLFGDDNDNVRLAAFLKASERAETNLEVLSKSDKDYSEYDYGNKTYDESILMHFYNDDSIPILREVARRTLNVDIQKQLFGKNSESINVALAANRKLDDELANSLIEAGGIETLKALVSNTCNEELYFKLLQNKYSVADNLGTNKQMIRRLEVQHKLASHENIEIRRQCASYLLDASLLLHCAMDEDAKIRKGVACNSHLSQSGIEVLLGNPTFEIVSVLHDNHPKLLAPFVLELIKVVGVDVRSYIARFFRLVPEWENVLRVDESSEVKLELMENCRTHFSDETKEILKGDADQKVKDKAIYMYG